MSNRNYTLFGETVSHIISDVFYINPTDEDVWSDINSLIIESESSSKKVPSSFYSELTVEASKPKGLLSWAPKAVTALKGASQLFGGAVSHQEPRIRDAKARSKRDKAEEFMNLKAFKDEDLQQKALGDMVQEISPKYLRQQQIKRAYIKE